MPIQILPTPNSSAQFSRDLSQTVNTIGSYFLQSAAMRQQERDFIRQGQYQQAQLKMQQQQMSLAQQKFAEQKRQFGITSQQVAHGGGLTPYQVEQQLSSLDAADRAIMGDVRDEKITREEGERQLAINAQRRTRYQGPTGPTQGQPTSQPAQQQKGEGSWLSGLLTPKAPTAPTMASRLPQPKLEKKTDRQERFALIDQYYPSDEAGVIKKNILAGIANETIDERADMLIDLVGLGERKKHRPGMLSGGERQRVALAAALICNPKLIIADEVTASLDPLTGEQILDVLDNINEELGVALLIATHAQQVASRAERILEIKDGIIYATHGSTIRLRDLAETRQLAVDNQNRISVPEDMMNLLGRPRSFKAKLVGQEIHLSIPTEELYELDKIRTCSVCGTLVENGSQVCSNCGTVCT